MHHFLGLLFVRPNGQVGMLACSYCDWVDPKRISCHSFFLLFFFSIQMLLGMATELQPILRPIWETTARLTLYSVVKPSAEVITWTRRHEGIKRLPLAHDGHHGTSPFLWLSCTFLWIFLKDVLMHVVRYSDSEYLNNWYNVPSRIRPFSREMDQLNFTTLVKENVLENIASKWRSFCIVTH